MNKIIAFGLPTIALALLSGCSQSQAAVGIEEGQFCDGIKGDVCAQGLICAIDKDNPEGGGTCVPRP